MRTIKKTSISALTICFLIGMTIAQLSHKSGYCPLRNMATRCVPRCVSDYQCGLNEKCCPNICGTESCVAPSPVFTGNGYKGSIHDGVYCAGVKCGPYEKCKFDRNSKRDRCVRT